MIKALIKQKQCKLNHEDTIIASNMPYTQFRNYRTKIRVLRHRKQDFLRIPLYIRQNNYTDEEKVFIISKLNDRHKYITVKQIQEQFEKAFGRKLCNKQNVYRNYLNINLRLMNSINKLHVEIVVPDQQKQVQQSIIQ